MERVEHEESQIPSGVCSRIGLTDDDMERWCNWIGDHLRTSIPRFSSCQFGLVDFAENRRENEREREREHTQK